MVLELERVNAVARSAHFGRALLTALAAVLFAIGWLVAKVLGVMWFAVAWCFAALRLGWQDARGTRSSSSPPSSGWVEVE